MDFGTCPDFDWWSLTLSRPFSRPLFLATKMFIFADASRRSVGNYVFFLRFVVVILDR